MATTYVVDALPTSWGATIIQANALSIPSGAYEAITHDKLKSVLGGTITDYLGLPQQKAGPEWEFYARSNMTGVDVIHRTIVGFRRIKVQKNKKSSVASSSDQPAVAKISHIFYQYTWHSSTLTLDVGPVLLDIYHGGHVIQVDQDPANGDLIVPTNAYQCVHEGLGFFLKPVAAGAPTWDRAYALVSGSNPMNF